jgi:hypothetical protein
LEIVKVKYYSDTTKAATGREYSYFSEERLNVGDLVQVPVKDHVGKAQVTAVDVSLDEIAPFKDAVKIIKAGSVIKPADLTPNLFQNFNPDISKKSAEIIADAIVGKSSGPYQTPEEERFNCPTDCEFVIPGGGSFDNPEPGGCGNEDAVPANASLETDELLPLCPGYRKKPFEPAQEGIIGRLVPDEAASKEAGTLVGDLVLKPSQEKPPALVVIETQAGFPTNDLFDLYLQAADLRKFAVARVIQSNEDLKPATNDLAIIANCKKAMTKRKAEIVGPFRETVDKINQAFNDLMSPIEEADRVTREKVGTYQIESQKRAAAAKRIEDEKFRLAQEEAKLNGTGEITVNTDPVVVPAPAPQITRTEMGSVSGRDNWKARVLDFKSLPDEYKLPNEQMLNALARSTKGTRQVPGVEFYNDRGVTVRTK